MRPSIDDDQRRILEFLALADGEGCVLASNIAGNCGFSRRGMGGRMSGLFCKGLIQRITVKEPPSFRSDGIYGWVLTHAGREALR